MLNAGHDLALCSVVRPKLIGDHHPRRSALVLQKLVHQTLGRLGLFHIPRHDIPSSHYRELRSAAMNLWAKIARA